LERNKVIKVIQEISKEVNAFDLLEGKFKEMSKKELSHNLLECGIIPESFLHDSSEEKLWAKYCDILLSKALTYLGVESEVIRARGDSADVRGKSRSYTIIGDAKAFRLSRTAKNQKDFKIQSLDDWRRSNTYAVLVAPLLQYRIKSSQIYYQAEERNVLLLSYVHLKFLLDNTPKKSLEHLWGVAGGIKPSKDAIEYWINVEGVVIGLTKKNYKDLKTYKNSEMEKTSEIGKEGIEYWESVIESYKNLSKEEAVKKLIEAEKIRKKIEVIEKTIAKDSLL